MSGMFERALGATHQLTDAATAQVDALRDGVADIDAGAFGADKVQQLLDAVDAAAPFIVEAGYQFVHAFVELGLPPRLVVRVRRVRPITDAEETALRERAADSKVGSVVLRTFLGAADLQHALSSQSFAASEIEFELGALPRARLFFAHHDPA